MHIHHVRRQLVDRTGRVVALRAVPTGVHRGADRPAAGVPDLRQHLGRGALGVVLNSEDEPVALQGPNEERAVVGEQRRLTAQHSSAERHRDPAGRLESLAAVAEPAGQAGHAQATIAERVAGLGDVRVGRPARVQAGVPQVDGVEAERDHLVEQRCEPATEGVLWAEPLARRVVALPPATRHPVAEFAGHEVGGHERDGDDG